MKTINKHRSKTKQKEQLKPKNKKLCFVVFEHTRAGNSQAGCEGSSFFKPCCDAVNPPAAKKILKQREVKITGKMSKRVGERRKIEKQRK